MKTASVHTIKMNIHGQSTDWSKLKFLTNEDIEFLNKNTESGFKKIWNRNLSYLIKKYPDKIFDVEFPLSINDTPLMTDFYIAVGNREKINYESEYFSRKN